jgi:hypothetical protein
MTLRSRSLAPRAASLDAGDTSRRGADRGDTCRCIAHHTPGRRRPLRVKMIVPALIEANAPGYRRIKYALFPPLGLASLASYLDPLDEVELLDEHVHTPLQLDDQPDLLVMSVYVTSARRAREIAHAYRARGTYVCVGGLHPSSLPDEAARHADTVIVGPGEEAWQTFLADFRAGRPLSRYEASPAARTLAGVPPVRRDLIDRRRHLCPNSLVVSRGCPHHCDFCYKDAFYAGGRLVLHATGGRGARRDRSAAGPASVLPRRPPSWERTVRRRTLRRHARDGASLSRREHGEGDPPEAI